MNVKKKKIYLDYASTTPVDKRVLIAMAPYFSEKFGNTMSLHTLGQEAKTALEESRKEIADLISAKSQEIIFTGSATESNNFALKGIAFANKERGIHIIISSIEHECVMESAKWLEKQGVAETSFPLPRGADACGFEVTRLKVDKQGLINLEELKSAIRKDTILVSVIHASNEIGAIQPIAEIGKICREKRVYFHTDASQSFGKIPINVGQMQLDLLTASSHKIYGPKGAGFLYVRQGVKIEPLLHGGGHEQGLRSSTVNVPAIVGFAKAAQICKKEMRVAETSPHLSPRPYSRGSVEEIKRLNGLGEKFVKGVLEKIPGSKLNGSVEKSLPNIVNFTFKGVEGETLVMKLDLEGILISTGSACSATSFKPSHVLLALGLNQKDAMSSVRFSFGRWTTERDIDYVLEVLPKTVRELRRK